MRRFASKVALVTGGARGIGCAIAERLASEGAALALLDIDEAAALEAAKVLAGADGRALALGCNVTDRAQIEQAVGCVIAGLGAIDVLVNNVGVATRANLADTAPDDWAFEVEGTLTGAYLVTRAVLPGMVARGRGAIVSIGSVNGLLALGNPAYSAAKAGLLSLTRSLALEYGPRGIRANLVSPGTIRTGHPTWQARLARDPEVFEKLARWYPVGRVGEPADVAAAVAFLAADEAGFVNGANLVVDGGLTAGMAPMIEELTLEMG